MQWSRDEFSVSSSPHQPSPCSYLLFSECCWRSPQVWLTSRPGPKVQVMAGDEGLAKSVCLPHNSTPQLGSFYLRTVSHPFFVGQSIQRGWEPAADLQGRMSTLSLCPWSGQGQPHPWSGGGETCKQAGTSAINALRHPPPLLIKLGVGGRL